MKNTKELKPLPYTPTKKQIKIMYPRLPHDTLMQDVNEIIRRNRQLPEDKPVYDKCVRLVEFQQLIQLYGPPKGYEKEFI